MQPVVIDSSSSTAEQLRPIVMAVVAAKLAVFALLMTTVNIPSPVTPTSMEMAALR